MRRGTKILRNNSSGRQGVTASLTRRGLILLFALSSATTIACVSTTAWAAAGELVIGNFSVTPQENQLPAGWEPLVFKKIKTHTIYKHIMEGGRGVIEAQSDKGASGLIRKLPVDPGQYPIITWQWKVKNILQNGDVTKKSGDDYAARIYINFAYDAKRVGFWEGVKFNTYKMIYGEYPPIAAINYIWANKAAVGTVVDNPYTDRVKMIVIESGTAKTGEWLNERRDIAADYRAAFKEEPPSIAGIAIMTDTDNTGESATAWYGDIIVRRQ
jgi:hypothetical protein